MNVNYLPEITVHDGITVIHDNIPGGTKARYLWQLYVKNTSAVYASSAEGTAQVALAATAQRWGRRCHIFSPDRKTLHPRQLQAQALGAELHLVRPGYLNVVQSRAKAFAAATDSFYVPFGAAMPHAPQAISEAAKCLKQRPKYLWCASGSGTLIKGLRQAWPNAEAHVTAVGHQLTALEVDNAIIHQSPFKYSQAVNADIDADPHYENKCWLMLQQWRQATNPKGKIVMWVVTGKAVNA